MIRRVGIVLWILVLIAAALWIYQKSRSVTEIVPEEVSVGSGTNPDGRVFADIAWRRLPPMQRLQMTERSGQPFDNADLAGQPYVVSFFFASCPTICRELNEQIRRLANEFQGTDLRFVSLTVDPENDTPERLQRYAAEFEADPRQWLMLTGQMYKVRALGEKQFSVIVDGVNHTGDLFLVDRWGRYRDRFTWDDPREMKRFSQVAREVLEERQPPLDKNVRTRNVLASLPHSGMPRLPWLYDFQLVDQDGADFWSRDLTGSVWIASFFFTRCPGICPRQNRYLAEIQADIAGRQASLVSITSDPQNDDSATLRQYARSLGAGDHWRFLTGDLDYIRRVGSEYLGIAAEGEHHSSMLVVVDRWGNVRGKIDWQVAGSREFLLNLIDALNQEKMPPADFQVVTNQETLAP